MAEKEPYKILIHPTDKDGRVWLTYDDEVKKHTLPCTCIGPLIGKYILSYSELIEKGKPSTQTCTPNYVPYFEKLFSFDRCEYVISNYRVQCSETCVDNGDGTPDKFDTVNLELPVVYTSLPWVDTVEACKGTGTLEDPFNFLPANITLNKDPRLCNNKESLGDKYICYIIGGGHIPDNVVYFDVTYNYKEPKIEVKLNSSIFRRCPYYVFNRSDHYTVDKKWTLCGKYFNINLTGNNTDVGKGFYNSYLKDCIVDTPIGCTLEDCVADDPINCTIIESPEKDCEDAIDISNCVIKDISSFTDKTGSNVTIYTDDSISFINCNLSNVTIIGKENKSVYFNCSSINFSSAIIKKAVIRASSISGNFDITENVTAYGNSSCECDGTLSAKQVYGYGGSIANVNPDVEGYIGEEVESVAGYFIPQAHSTYLGQQLKTNGLYAVYAYDCDIEYNGEYNVDASYGHILSCNVNANVSYTFNWYCVPYGYAAVEGNIYDSIVHVTLAAGVRPPDPDALDKDCGKDENGNDRPLLTLEIWPHINSWHCNHPCTIGVEVTLPSNCAAYMGYIPPDLPDCYPNRISCSTSK